MLFKTRGPVLAAVDFLLDRGAEERLLELSASLAVMRRR
jgi:hypothetical protein